MIRIDNGGLTLFVNTDAGCFTLNGGERGSIRNAYAAVCLDDGRERRTIDYRRHAVTNERAGRVVVRHIHPGEPELVQIFEAVSGRAEFHLRLEVRHPRGVRTNHVAPLVCDEVIVPTGGAVRVLEVPFDNDGYSRYRSRSAPADALSHEVTVLFDNATRRGWVIGSLDHDLWKTGIEVRGGLRVRVFGGAAGDSTHDKEPHGFVAGKAVRSPRILVGGYPDWRDGLERFGQACARIQPALPWGGAVPFGWNSWSAYKAALKAEHAFAAVDALASPPLAGALRSGGTAFVNLDSFWDNLKEDELRAFVRRAHDAGLKAGIYYTPFTAWYDRLEGKYDNRWPWDQMAIQRAAGGPLPKLDGGWALDPTHPGVQALNARQYRRFIDWGFDFLKLDFMTHGALEGVHHDPSVTTGIAAYRVGMRQIVDTFDPRRIGRPFFLSLSIAPLFPHGFAHSRRVSCDAFADIGATEYLLNSQTYGWWQHGSLYAFNDPDHSVVYKVHDERPVSPAEGRSRLTASVTVGGMLLDGDDFTSADARARVNRLFTNPEVLALARRGRRFRPVEGDTDAAAGETFVLADGAAAYVAVFNYHRTERDAHRLELARLGLDPKARYRVHDLWTGDERTAHETLSVDLAPAACALLRLSR